MEDQNNQKRLRRDIPTRPHKINSSKIYQHYRSIGNVTSAVPIVVQQRGQENFVVAAVGRSFQIYAAPHFRLKFVSQPPLPANLDGLCVMGDLVFASAASVGSGSSSTSSSADIYKFYRAKLVDKLSIPSVNVSNNLAVSVVKMISLGDHLIAAYSDNVLRVWDSSSNELYTEITLPRQFSVSTMLHPSTYLNKILVASAEGKLQLWNVKTNKLIFEFGVDFGSAITALEQSPVVDVVAVGLLNGGVVLHNLKTDKFLMRFDQEGRVCAISFRTDDLPLMATSNSSGDIALWNLDEKRLFNVMHCAHDGAIPSLHFFRGQPLLLSSGADNAIKQWIFESLDGVPRLLRSRSGHHLPPAFIRFYDNQGRFLLSAGRDRALRLFCTIRDEQNVELSQGSLEHKARVMHKRIDSLRLPCITQLASATVREFDWDNIVTAHLNCSFAKTWSFDKKKLGQHTLYSPDKSKVKCVTLSSCGNFALLGTSSGRVDMFNMQSGIHRKHFGKCGNGHTGTVSGVAVDQLNRTVVSASLDGSIKFWDFKTAECIETLSLDTSVAQILLKQENNLLAVASDDLCVRLVDIDTRKVVREFWGHDGRITDMCFSPDGKWLVSSAFDRSIRTWDITSGCLVDAFLADQIVTSMTFSPANDFLVTCHANSLGLHLWANRTQFTNVPLTKLPSDIELVECGMVEEVPEEDDEHTVQIEEGDNIDLTYTSPDQLAEGLVTLSLEPKSKWQNLIHLETIKKRNKPKEPPKAPEKAPFFLPTLPGLEPKFQVDEASANNGGKREVDDAASRQLNMSSMTLQTDFVTRLISANQDQNYESFGAYIKTLPPSNIDFEIRSLPLNDDYEILKMLLSALDSLLETSRNFEMVQAILNVVLKIHSDVFVEHPAHFREQFKSLLEKQQSKWEKMDKLIQKSICLIDFARNI